MLKEEVTTPGYSGTNRDAPFTAGLQWSLKSTKVYKNINKTFS